MGVAFGMDKNGVVVKKSGDYVVKGYALFQLRLNGIAFIKVGPEVLALHLQQRIRIYANNLVRVPATCNSIPGF